MSDLVIELKQVCKSFDSIAILKNIDLEIKKGEFLTLLGPSGCGKTTILRLLAGFETPSSGTVLINGEDMLKIEPEDRHINTVFQSYALFPHMSVFDNVAFGPKIRGVPKVEISTQVMEALRMVKLEHLADRKPAQLSGGQQQRVAIARAVVNKPLVLLLDEPLSALDYKLRKEMQIELKQLQRRLGITFIFVTHDQEEALSMSDRIAVMNAGRIEQLGTPKNIYESPNSLFVARFVGESNILAGEVIKVDDDCVEMRLENKIISLKNTKNFQVSQSVNLLLRPEDLHVYDEEEGIPQEPYLHGIIEEVIYKGTTVDLLIRLDSGKQIAATQFFNEDDPKLDFRMGERVFAGWLEGWEVLLPSEAAENSIPLSP
ncbi:MAG: iron(III)/spermidine/putrescine transporter, ATP-binding protein [Pseudomonadota bacterium]|jgi:spermidine/putrescine transport system ATP-binding protein